MVDGGFRENIFSAEYFSKQDFPDDQYEIIWVDFFNAPHQLLSTYPRIKVSTLKKSGTYHSSYCFNEAIKQSTGEIIVIPDADQIVKPDFLSKVWDCFQDMQENHRTRVFQLDQSRVSRISGQRREEGYPQRSADLRPCCGPQWPQHPSTPF